MYSDHLVNISSLDIRMSPFLALIQPTEVQLCLLIRFFTFIWAVEKSRWHKQVSNLGCLNPESYTLQIEPHWVAGWQKKLLNWCKNAMKLDNFWWMVIWLWNQKENTCYQCCWVYQRWWVHPWNVNCHWTTIDMHITPAYSIWFDLWSSLCEFKTQSLSL